METIVAKIVPILITAATLAIMMLFVMGIGWVSGKFIRKILGIGGK